MVSQVARWPHQAVLKQSPAPRKGYFSCPAAFGAFISSIQVSKHIPELIAPLGSITPMLSGKMPRSVAFGLPTRVVSPAKSPTSIPLSFCLERRAYGESTESVEPRRNGDAPSRARKNEIEAREKRLDPDVRASSAQAFRPRPGLLTHFHRRSSIDTVHPVPLRVPLDSCIKSLNCTPPSVVAGVFAARSTSSIGSGPILVQASHAVAV